MQVRASLGTSVATNSLSKRPTKTKETSQLAASLQISSKAPDFNRRLFQSNFIAYNWQNNFKNTAVRNLKLDLKSPWVAASASLTQLDNYNYFSADTQSKPMQYESTVNYLQIKAHKELVFWKFAWDNTFQYQNVASGAEVLKVPDFIGRSTFYFSEYLFKKKSLYLQTGITAHYFSAYQANKYHPRSRRFCIAKRNGNWRQATARLFCKRTNSKNAFVCQSRKLTLSTQQDQLLRNSKPTFPRFYDSIWARLEFLQLIKTTQHLPNARRNSTPCIAQSRFH